MRGTERSFLSGNMRRRNWGRVVRDILLLPPALLYILVEHVFWAGAKAVLEAASRLDSVRFLQRRIRRLPPWAVLPLFLVPELVSHLGGLWATVLLVERKFALATLVGVFVKGLATVATVWIYQNCEPALLRIRWFARAHAEAMRVRDWVEKRTRRMRALALQQVDRNRSRLARRFSALRLVLAAKLGLIRRRAHRRQSPQASPRRLP